MLPVVVLHMWFLLRPSPAWIVDTGVIDHLAGMGRLFFYSFLRSVHVANVSFTQVAGE